MESKSDLDKSENDFSYMMLEVIMLWSRSYATVLSPNPYCLSDILDCRVHPPDLLTVSIWSLYSTLYLCVLEKKWQKKEKQLLAELAPLYRALPQSSTKRFWLISYWPWHSHNHSHCQHVHTQSPSHVQLSVTPWTVAHQAPQSMGFLRQEH